MIFEGECEKGKAVIKYQRWNSLEGYWQHVRHWCLTWADARSQMKEIQAKEGDYARFLSIHRTGDRK